MAVVSEEMLHDLLETLEGSMCADHKCINRAVTICPSCKTCYCMVHGICHCENDE